MVFLGGFCIHVGVVGRREYAAGNHECKIREVVDEGRETNLLVAMSPLFSDRPKDQISEENLLNKVRGFCAFRFALYL